MAKSEQHSATLYSMMIDLLEKSVQAKEHEIEVLKKHVEIDNKATSDEISDIDRRSAGIKKLRVNAQKQIFELEKKLNYIENDLGEGAQPDVENLDELDLNKEATITNNKTQDILRGLRSKLENISTGEKMEARFIRELPK